MSAPEIPGFTHLSHLGSGGYSEVHLYEQHRPRRQVAIKVIRDSLDDRQLERFAAEADTMASLAEHPYIVPVLAADVTADGRPYLVMRYFPPPDLGARVKRQPLTVAEALRTGIQIASAVETAHRAGILHRDIKPANILVSSYRTPALTDFGIAGTLHQVDADDEVGVSIPWSPPEILNGQSNGSIATDVYSLGATIWNLLTGRSPYRSTDANTNSAVALQARIHQMAPPPTGVEGVPAALDRLLQQCLAKNPAHRPASAMEVARGLAAIEQAERLSRTDIVVLDAAPAAPVVPVGDAPGTVRRPVVPGVDDDGPRTRARAGQVDAGSPDEVRPTQRRGVVAAPAEAAAPRQASNRRWGLIAAAAVVVAGAVTAALMLSGSKGPPSSGPSGGPQPTPTADLGPGLTPATSGPAPEIGTPRLYGNKVVFPVITHGSHDVLRWYPGAEGQPLGAEQPVAGDAIVTPRQAGRTCVILLVIPPGASTPSQSPIPACMTTR